MTLKNIPSTNPKKLSAERMAKVAKALIRRLVEKSVLLPPQKGVVPLLPRSPSTKDAKEQEAPLWGTIVEDRSIYRAFRLIEGGKGQESAARSAQVVAEFAGELQVQPAQLLEVLRAAGIEKSGPEDSISDRDKTALLAH